jgi:hypothetical protein
MRTTYTTNVFKNISMRNTGMWTKHEEGMSTSCTADVSKSIRMRNTGMWSKS